MHDLFRLRFQMLFLRHVPINKYPWKSGWVNRWCVDDDLYCYQAPRPTPLQLDREQKTFDKGEVSYV